MPKASRNKKEKPIHKQLLSIIDEYLVDLECLREMHASVVPVLQAQDKERKDALSEIFRAAKEKGQDESETATRVQSEPKEDNTPPTAELEEVKKETTNTEDIQKGEKKKFTLKFRYQDFEFITTNSKK